jgi:hypothetical protein
MPHQSTSSFKAISLALLGLMAISDVKANHGSPMNCFDCAALNGGESKMCQWNGKFTDPQTANCCRKGYYSEYCVSEPWNTCSPYYKSDNQRYYNFCPNINEKTCGGPTVIDVESLEMQTFEYNGLKYSPSEKKYETCYYEVRIPKYTYMAGSKVGIQITKVEEGVNLMLRASRGIKNETSLNINATLGVPELNKKYLLPEGDGFIVTVVPKLNSNKTGFSFSYWAEGSQYEQVDQMILPFYNEYLVDHKDSKTYRILILIFSFFFVILGGCCLICGILCRCRTQKKVGS